VRARNILFKITAWIILLWCFTLSLAALSLIFVLFILIKDANAVKMVFVDIGLVVIASLVFIVGLGFFEFVTSFVQVEEQIEELESDKPRKSLV